MPALARPLPQPDAHSLAFTSFYRAWFGPVTRWLPAMGVARGDVEDVAQEVLLAARARWGTFDGAAPSAWLYAISVRMASNHRRRAWARKVSVSDELCARAIAAETPESLAGRRELGRLGEDLLSVLSDKLRRVFVLAEVGGLSGKEIAELEQIPAGTVHTRLHHARKQLEARSAGQRTKVLRLLVAVVLACLVSIASAMVWRFIHRVVPSFLPTAERAELDAAPRTLRTQIMPAVIAHAEPPRRQTAPKTDAPAPTAPSVSSDEEQAQLLLEAYKAVHHGDAARALQRVDEYLQRFPDGTLLEEALLVALDTARDDLPRARPYARLYLARLPDGLHAARARALLSD